MEPPREEKSLEGVGSLSTVALEGTLGSSFSSGAVLGLGFPCLLCCLAGLDCFPGGRFCHTAPIANPKCAQEHRPMELPPRLVFAPCCGIQHVRTDRSAIASALHCLDAVLAARYTALSPRAQIIAVYLTTRR